MNGTYNSKLAKAEKVRKTVNDAMTKAARLAKRKALVRAQKESGWSERFVYRILNDECLVPGR